jgi:hypothetical protein
LKEHVEQEPANREKKTSIRGQWDEFEQVEGSKVKRTSQYQETNITVRFGGKNPMNLYKRDLEICKQLKVINR